MDKERKLIKGLNIADNKLTVTCGSGRGRSVVITESVTELTVRGVEVGNGLYIPWRRIEPQRSFYPLEEPVFMSDSDKSDNVKKD